MAKTAKVKKRQVTVHSRAARRAASPSIDLDKSAKPSTRTRDSASPSRPSKINHHALAAKDAGIQKKQKKTNMTRAQRLRYEKGLERAEENLDKLQLKRAKSAGKEKTVKGRAKGWDDINGEGLKKTKKSKSNEAVEDDEQRKDREWVSDEEIIDNEQTAPVEGEVKGDGKEVEVIVPASISLPVEEDEML